MNRYAVWQWRYYRLFLHWSFRLSIHGVRSFLLICYRYTQLHLFFFANTFSYIQPHTPCTFKAARKNEQQWNWNTYMCVYATVRSCKQQNLHFHIDRIHRARREIVIIKWKKKSHISFSRVLYNCICFLFLLGFSSLHCGLRASYGPVENCHSNALHQDIYI